MMKLLPHSDTRSRIILVIAFIVVVICLGRMIVVYSAKPEPVSGIYFAFPAPEDRELRRMNGEGL